MNCRFFISLISLTVCSTTFAAQDCGTVIVGAGGAGMRAAIELKEAGQPVCLVEKMPFVGGSTNHAATYFSVINTKEQQAAGLGMNLEDYIADQKKKNPNIDSDRLRELHTGGQEALDWLNSLGANISRPLSTYQIATKDGRSLGSTIVKVVKQKLDDVGIKPMLRTTVAKINIKDGKVTGVTVIRPDGKEDILNANNVILATGGFASNPDAVAKYAPKWKGTSSTSAKGATGDALKMVEEIGGSLKFLDSVRMNPSVHIDKEGVSSSLSAARAEGGIMVNLEGKRFCNDYYPDYTQLSKWILEQPKGEVWVVIDDKAMKKSKRLQGFKDKGYFVSAPTITELAKKMGVPEKNFKETIDAYRKAVQIGEDKEFGRKFNLSIDFTQPPFYAVLTRPGVQVTLGGIEVNKNFEVVDKKGQPINGLYAVGEVAHDGLFGLSPTVVNTVFGKKVAEIVKSKN